MQQGKITARQVLGWVELWKKGDKDADEKIQKLLNILKENWEKEEWEIPEIEEYGGFDCARAIICNEYPLPDFVLEIFTYNHAGAWGDYYNEYGGWGAYWGTSKEMYSINDILEQLRVCPIWRFEERYFSEFYEKETRTLRKETDLRVIELNRLADHINANFEKMSMEDMEKHYNEVCRILYDDKES